MTTEPETEPKTTEPGTGYRLPLLLLAGFRELIEALHLELGARGHPDLRPAHGFALQAIGGAGGGLAAADLATRLGVTKQAAGKTLETLAGLGYISLTVDPSDARRRTATLTARGRAALSHSAAIFDRLGAQWADRVGEQAVAALERTLAELTGPVTLRTDSASWLGGQ
ncbi:MarR family transcriptional regulator [Nakamurella aerolata]|uniref:Winged helix-turn-helix transcriptional regulator n=1 Tax=Nakamurella aerolata TaxID=1656892 RepID=A0A849A9A6_9ACTN|nr:winged helix-turn-helix transcriptional regulator [Nakamurella aerolata]